MMNNRFQNWLIEKLPCHYAWLILISCCALSGASLGMVVNCKGLFIAPACAELGCSVSQFTLYTTFYGIGSAVTLLGVNRVFRRFPIRIVLTAALFVLCLSTAAMGSFHRVEQWYLAGAAQGISGAFLLFVPVPMLLNSWFEKRRGFALGISAMASGLFGAVMNPVLNTLIAQHGWRAAYFLQGTAAFLLAAPFCLLFIVKTPQECGLCAYGAVSAAANTAERARRSVEDRAHLFPYCICFTVIATFCTAYAQHFSNYAISVGFDSHIGAMMVSVSMIGGMAAKTLFGAASDRLGSAKVSVCSLTLSFLGFILLCVCGRWPLGCWIAAALAGTNNANLSIIVPLLVGEIAPDGRYEDMMSKTTIGTMLTGACSTALIGALYDWRGSYIASFFFGALLQVIALAAVLRIFRRKLS